MDVGGVSEGAESAVLPAGKRCCCTISAALCLAGWPLPSRPAAASLHRPERSSDASSHLAQVAARQRAGMVWRLMPLAQSSHIVCLTAYFTPYTTLQRILPI